MNTFDFDPENAVVHCKAAVSHIPKVYELKIEVRPFNGFLYFTSGQFIYRCEGKEIILGANDILFLPANCKKYEYTISGPNPHYMKLEIELFDCMTGAQLLKGDIPKHLCTDTNGELAKLFKQAVKSFADPSCSAQLTLKSNIFSLLAALSQQNKSQTYSGKQIKIEPAVKWLNENYQKSVYTSDLATLCNISESQMRRLFHDCLGCSPITYRNQLRINIGKDLLKTQSFTVGEIADILGFEDIYAFSHAFKKIVGMSPSNYTFDTPEILNQK